MTILKTFLVVSILTAIVVLETGKFIDHARVELAHAIATARERNAQ